MTEHRLRELLSEVADTVPRPDMAEQAWRRSVRVRRRRVAGSALLAVGAVVAVIGVVGVLNDGAGTAPDRTGQTDPVAPPPVPEAALSRPPEARVDGARAWIGPTIEEESRLPYSGSVLPPTIDLAASDIETTDAPGPAVAAFAASDADHLLEEVLVLGQDGQVSQLDVSGLGLELVQEPDDDYVMPLNISSLSPDGKTLVFAQNDRVVVYDLVEGTDEAHSNGESESYNVGWSPTENDDWQIQLVKDVMDPDTGDIDERPDPGSDEETDDPVAVWPIHYDGGRAVQAWIDRPEPALGPDLRDAVLIEVTGADQAMLALPVDDGDPIRPRSRVVEWLGDNVAFQSQDYGTYRVLAWDTNSGAVRLLSEAELPDDWDEGVTASWSNISLL